jgi:glutaredoxin 3
MALPVKMYTTVYCGFCRQAKALLQSRGIAFEEIDVTTDDEKREWLVEATGRRTVPQIFIGDDAIGGYQELAALDSRGELLARVGA